MPFLPEPEANALRDRFDAVCSRLADASKAAGRNAADIRLIAISKKHPAPMLAELFSHWQQGLPVFGENYVQEALEKQTDVAALLGHLSINDPPLEWHFVGHVQSRKAKDIAGRFSLIHTLDSEKLAEQLQKAILEKNLPPQSILIQINIGEEAQKSGVPAADAERFINSIQGMAHIRIEGLMCLPPFFDDAQASRPYFVAMRSLQDALRSSTGLALPHLSMGMSHDCEVAVSEGATIVRVGTDIFGPRQYR